MSRERTLTIVNSIQLILLIGLFYYFIQTKETMPSALTGSGIAISGLIMAIADFKAKHK